MFNLFEVLHEGGKLGCREVQNNDPNPVARLYVCDAWNAFAQSIISQNASFKIQVDSLLFSKHF